MSDKTPSFDNAYGTNFSAASFTMWTSCSKRVSVS